MCVSTCRTDVASASPGCANTAAHWRPPTHPHGRCESGNHFCCCRRPPLSYPPNPYRLKPFLGNDSAGVWNANWIDCSCVFCTLFGCCRKVCICQCCCLTCWLCWLVVVVVVLVVADHQSEVCCCSLSCCQAWIDSYGHLDDLKMKNLSYNLRFQYFLSSLSTRRRKVPKLNFTCRSNLKRYFTLRIRSLTKKIITRLQFQILI